MSHKHFSVVVKIHHKGGSTTELPTKFYADEWSEREALEHMRNESSVMKVLDSDAVYEMYIRHEPQELTNESHTWPDA